MDKKIRSAKIAYMYGLLDSIPLILGYLPVAAAFGLAVQGAGFGTGEGLLFSALVFAGGSQFALLELLRGGTSLVASVFISLCLNLRHVLYGPVIAPLFKGIKPSKIPLLSFGLTDEVFATAQVRLPAIPLNLRPWWLLGLETGAYSSWVIGTGMGALGSAALLNFSPVLSNALKFAPAALFFSLLLPMLKKQTLIPVLTATLVTLFFSVKGYSAYGIIAAAIVGPLTGLLGERLWKTS